MKIHRTLRAVLLASALSLPLLLAAQPAHAGGCDCGTIRSTVNRAADKVIKDVNKHTTQVGDSITQAIGEMTQRLMESITANQRTQTTAQAKIADARNVADIELERKRRAADATRRFTRSPANCAGATGTTGLAAADAAVPEMAKDLGKNLTARNAGLTDGANDAPVSVSVAEKVFSPEKNRASIVAAYESRPAEERDEVVKPLESIFNKYTLRQADYDKAYEYLLLATNARPDIDRQIWEDMTPDKKVAMLERLARTNTTQAPLVDAIARRGASVPMGEWASYLLENKGASAEEISKLGDRVSQMEILRLMVESRFGSPTYITETLNEMSPDQHVREQTEMMSLMLRLLWEQYKLEEKNISVQAVAAR